MTLPYRAVLQLPPEKDTIRLAERHVQMWLEQKFKSDSEVKLGFIKATLLEQGIHLLPRGATLEVVRDEPDPSGARALLFRFTEHNRSGRFQVDVVAIDVTDENRTDYLLIEARALDEASLDQVDPPRIVKDLLSESQDVVDGRTPVYATPRLIGKDEVDEVLRAIQDPLRSVSVVVGVSIDAEAQQGMLDAMTSLTQRLTGTATSYLLKEEAFEAIEADLPSSHSLIGGERIRTFLPNVDLTEPHDGRRHKILSPATFTRVLRADGRVTEGIQKAFAAQVRTGMLETPLPRAVARRLMSLNTELNEIRRTASVAKKVEAELARRQTQTGPLTAVAASPRRTKQPLLHRSPLKERVRRFISQWLGRDEPEPQPIHIDELDRFVEDLRATKESLLETIAGQENEIQRLNDVLERQRSELAGRDMELAQLERQESDHADRIRFLEGRLKEVGRGGELHLDAQEKQVWEVPEDFTELWSRIAEESSEKIGQFVVYTNDDVSGLQELEVRDQWGRYLHKCWQQIRVLHDYAKLKSDGSFSGNVGHYLTSNHHDGYKVPSTQYAPGETERTLGQFSEERFFPVPPIVDRSGRVLMTEHFKISTNNTIAPRMYFFDDTNRSGKIFVGYIGRHLTNSKTRNA